jgi:2-succinyl-6-hydroxy-2,4-cyclohexadiene-1-carboxylate synthase
VAQPSTRPLVHKGAGIRCLDVFRRWPCSGVFRRWPCSGVFRRWPCSGVFRRWPCFWYRPSRRQDHRVAEYSPPGDALGHLGLPATPGGREDSAVKSTLGHLGLPAAPPRTSGAVGVTGLGHDRPRATPPRTSGAMPIVFLHGFTQTGRSWDPVVESFPESFRAKFPMIFPDAPGHGKRSELRADPWAAANLLVSDLPGPTATWCGYSMGARLALHVALAHPSRVVRLVLVSGSAGIEDDSERQARRLADEALAGQIERGGRDGLLRFLEEWLSQPLFATLSPDRAGLPERLANDPAGLASSLRLAGTGAQAPLWSRLGELGERALPVLLVAGELDTAYRQHAERMAALIGPTASVAVVEGAGHACHLERPRAVARLIAGFCLDEVAGTGFSGLAGNR